MAGGSGNDQAPIIIKKIKRGEEGHHGGAWKVAYADFVTAMMAFFLLLWLLNVTTSEQKMGIADYFSPASPSKQESGAGGILSGRTITVEGSKANASSPPQITLPTPSIPSSNAPDDGMEDFESSADAAAGSEADGQGRSPYIEGMAELDAAGRRAEADRNRDGELSPEEVRDALAKLEQERFDEAVRKLRQAIQAVPEMQTLAESLIIDQTPEGLRIQLVDQFGYSMFPSGGAQMFPQTAQLLSAVAQAVARLPNRLSVTGHTDGLPFRQGAGFSNWELSTDRANASRRALEAAGVSPDRFESVIGRADKEHLFPEDPNSPRNRRISIVLLREQPIGEAANGP
ncbi:flagellar motor protein MotB [Indioceanicola profundi]|uniref:flagellar motor protein MotB n=1 Tax=Indioceanicola profundi TaxID=2220096 RepID=UPI000E6A9CE6|nr:flagellar motor protein MotB [Indioceanicola profundi]